MAYGYVLTGLELVALASCIWGFQKSYGNSPDKLAVMCNSAWFVIGGLACLMGIIPSVMRFLSTDPYAFYPVTREFRRIYYILCWLTVVIGYPMLVASFVQAYYNHKWIYALLVLPWIPIFCWETSRYVALSTHLVIGALIPPQLWIAYNTNNKQGMFGAGIIVANLFSLSLRTGLNILGFTPKESYIVGVGIGSIFWAGAIETISQDPASSYYKNL